MFFLTFWTKIVLETETKLVDVGAGARARAGAKTLDARSWNRSLKFEYRLHSPGKFEKKI